jgi:hypothetical protein
VPNDHSESRSLVGRAVHSQSKKWPQTIMPFTFTVIVTII